MHFHRASTVALLALGIAGCGGSNAAVTVTTQASSGSATSSQQTASNPTAPLPSTSSATVTSARGPACTAADLALSFETTNGALGNIVASFALRNTGSATCHTYGYPGVQFVDHTGDALPTSAVRVTRDILGPATPTRIELAPGQLASFRIVATKNESGAGCATAAGLQAIAPDDTATMRTTIPDGLYECQRVTLTPLIPGNGLPPGT